MNSAPACGGLYNRTFSPEQGEEVFLCLKAGTKPLPNNSQSSAFSMEAAAES